VCALRLSVWSVIWGEEDFACVLCYVCVVCGCVHWGSVNSRAECDVFHVC